MSLLGTINVRLRYESGNLSLCSPLYGIFLPLSFHLYPIVLSNFLVINRPRYSLIFVSALLVLYNSPYYFPFMTISDLYKD